MHRQEGTKLWNFVTLVSTPTSAKVSKIRIHSTCDLGSERECAGVSKAIGNVNIIGPVLIKSGLKVTQQKEIDDFLLMLGDGIPNKAQLGAKYNELLRIE